MTKSHLHIGHNQLRILILSLAAISLFFVFAWLAMAGTGSAVASFATGCYTAGNGVTVNIAVTPDGSTSVYAVQDIPPGAWSVSNINNGGSFDSVNMMVKWGPFFDHAGRTLSYTVTPPTGSSASASFAGTASFDGSSLSISGSRVISRCCSYSISPASSSYQAGASAGSVTIACSPDCGWTAVSNSSWITLTSSTGGSGNGIVAYSVDANTDNSRTGTITIAGQTFTIDQSECFRFCRQAIHIQRKPGPDQLALRLPTA